MKTGTCSPRKRPTQLRSQTTVEAIEEAAAHIFCEVGFERASTNAIAARAGVSIGSLYQYFPHKLSLLAAAKARHLRGLWSLIAGECAAAGPIPLEAALRRIVAAAVGYNCAREGLLQACARHLPQRAAADHRLHLAKSAHRETLGGFFRAHAARIKVGSSEAAFVVPLLAAGIFTAEAGARPAQPGPAPVVDDITSALLNYLT